MAGFIGSHLAEALLTRGDEVRGLDNFATGKRANVPAGVELIEADLADAEAVAAACVGAEAVLHQGALPSVPRSVREPRLRIGPTSTAPSTCWKARGPRA